MGELTSDNCAPQIGYERWTVKYYISHKTVTRAVASQFFIDFKPCRLYNYACFHELIKGEIKELENVYDILSAMMRNGNPNIRRSSYTIVLRLCANGNP